MNKTFDEETLHMLEEAEMKKLRGDHFGAISILEKLLMHDPSCASAYEEIGDNYLSLREMDKSKKALLEALRLDNESANAHYLLGFLFSLEQNWELSVQELKEADKRHNNHPEILRCLGWSLFNLPFRRNQGLSVLERAKTLVPDDINILCDLGVCYMTDNHPQKARKIFNQVIALSPHSEQAEECRNFIKMLRFEEQK